MGSKKSEQKIPTMLYFHTKLSPWGNYTQMIYGMWVFNCRTLCTFGLKAAFYHKIIFWASLVV